MKLIVSKHFETSELAVNTWWLDNPQDRAVIFATESHRQAWVNFWQDPEQRRLARDRSFTVNSQFAGRDDIKELAVADAHSVLPALFKRLGLAGRLDLVVGTSPLGAGW